MAANSLRTFVLSVDGSDQTTSQSTISTLVGKNKGHPAVFPVDLPAFFIKLFCPPDGLVCDPFGGSGTTGIAAIALSRRSLLIDNNQSYCRIAAERIVREAPALPEQVILRKETEHRVRYEEIPAAPVAQISFFEKPPVYHVKHADK